MNNKAFNTMFYTIFVLALVGVLASWIFYGFVAYKGYEALTDPQNSSAVELVKELKKAIKE